jgi:hypothetical protein
VDQERVEGRGVLRRATRPPTVLHFRSEAGCSAATMSRLWIWSRQRVCLRAAATTAPGSRLATPTIWPCVAIVSEKDHREMEGPQHEVTIARPFAVSKFDVTFDEWDQCTKAGVCPRASDTLPSWRHR